MKKIIFTGLLVLMTSSTLCAGRGGDAVVGALGGLAVGTMIGQATAADSSKRRADRTEEEIRRVEERQELRREQDKERIDRLERELERSQMKNKVKSAKTQSNKIEPLMVFLLVLIGMLMILVIGLGAAILRRRP